MYNKSNGIEFDPAKDQINRSKHGVSLALAESFEWDSALDALDDRYAYGEPRFIAYGLISDRVYCLVYTLRGETLRAISLRKANKREVNDLLSKRTIVMPTDEENAAINRGIAADPDTRELSTEEIRRMRPARETLPRRIGEGAAAELLKRRGRPPADVTKVATSVRYDRDVLDAFRSTGEGWQTRMNDALRDYAKSHGMM